MIKRPLLIITICYIISILWGIYLKKYILLFCLIMLVINMYIYIKKRNKIYFIFYNICIFVLCACTLIIKNKDDSFNRFSINSETDRVSIIGVIVSEENDSKYNNNYVVKVINLNNTKCNKKMYLRVKKDNKNLKLQYGNLVKAEGIFEKGEVQRNYKGYSVFNSLKYRNIYGIIKSENIKIIKNNSTNTYNLWINKLQKKLKNNIEILVSKDNNGIAKALLIGDNSGIESDRKQLFSDANLSHILAISGMHVSYVIIGLGFALKKISNRKSKYIMIFFLIFFAFLTGGSPSVIRAVMMCILTLIASLIYRKSDTINNIAISALIILIKNPYNLFNLGFQLSFMGTLGIVLFHSKIEYKTQIIFNNIIKLLLKNETKFLNITNNKFIKNFIVILSVSISANILIVPIIIYNFNNISFVFLISNLLITPILGVLIFSGYISLLISIISIKIAYFPAKIYNYLISIFIKIAQISSNIKFLKFVVGTPKLYTLILMYLIILLLSFNSKKHLKQTIGLFICFTIITSGIFKYKTKLSIYFVDVGQGDCTLIVTPSNKKILIDGGGSESGDYNVGEKILIPYLYDRQIKKIDFIIFSHFDTDHAGGLLSVMEELKVETAIISKQGKSCENYEKFKEIAKKKKIKIMVVDKGDRLQIDKDLYFDILWPNNTNFIEENVLNNNSIVCKMVYKNVSMLFTGDIEEMAEKEILNEYKNNLGMLNSSILKAGHHGSKTSSIEEFINIVNPEVVLIGVGKNNKFGHPNEEVLDRMKKCGAQIFRTDRNGEIIITVDKNGIINCKKTITM